MKGLHPQVKKLKRIVTMIPLLVKFYFKNKSSGFLVPDSSIPITSLFTPNQVIKFF